MARHVVPFLLAALVWLVFTPALLAQSRVDALGDPLPEGAIARLGTTRMRHFRLPDHYCSGLGCITWSPDGKVIATSSYIAPSSYTPDSPIGVEARLWEASTGKPLSLLENNLRYGPGLLRFTPDNKTLAAAAGDKIVLWDVATGKEQGQLVGRQGDFDALVFQDAGKTLVSVSRDGAVQWWDVSRRKVVRQWQLLANDPKQTDKGEPILFTGIRHACFSADGKSLAVEKWWSIHLDRKPFANQAQVFDLSARKDMWREDAEGYSCGFAFTPDGKRLAVSRAGSFTLREGATGHRLTDPPSLYPSGMDFSPDSRTLALRTGGGIAFWSPDNKTPVREFPVPHHYGLAQAPAFSPDGKKVAVETGLRFQVLDVATGKPAVYWPSYEERLRDLAFSADGRNLFTEDHSIDTATWRQRSGYERPSKRFDDVQSVSLDHTLRVAEDGAHPDTLFDTRTGRVVARFTAPKRAPGLHGGFFSSRASLYVMQDRSCDGMEVDTLFAIPSGKRLCQLSFGKHVGTSSWSFSADESRAAFCALDTGMIHVHDTATGKLLWQLGKVEPHSGTLALSPGGNMLAAWTTDLRGVQIYELGTGKSHRSLALDQNALGNIVTRLAWSPDNRMLAVGSWDNPVRLWEVASAQVRREFRGHLARATCLAFSPDGNILASASEDTTLLIWKTLFHKKRRDPLTEDDLSALWENLAADAGKAYQAQAELLHAPLSAVPLLAKRLQPAPTIDPRPVAGWIKDLDSDKFRVRDEAAKELQQLGELARESMRKALAANPTIESRRRLQQLLGKLNQFTPSQLRSLRAIEVLEGIGTPEAVRIMERLMQGNPDSLATAESRTVVARMKKKK